MNREKVIKELHDARRYLEDKEWSDRGASPHIDAINDALALLKEQEETELCDRCGRRRLKSNRSVKCMSDREKVISK